MSVTEIATELGLAHPTVSQTLKELEKRGLVTSNPSPSDARKRHLHVSKKGEKLRPQIEPLWRDISNAIHHMLSQNENSLLEALAEAENRFEEKHFFDLVMEETKERQLMQVKILDYQSNLKKHFTELNYQWIEKYFEVEDVDRKILDQPEDHIIDSGGRIIFAHLDDKVVGTCALIRIDDHTYELSKMAVSERVQGKQVGKKLGLEIIKLAKDCGWSSVGVGVQQEAYPGYKAI